MENRKLGFGFMRLPLKNPAGPANIDMEMLNQMVDAFMERGFSYFDSAYMYHMNMSEIAIRESLVKRHKRNSFTLATKLPTMFLKTKDDPERIFNEQLEKCGVDYFDYYLLHNLNIFNYEIAQNLNCFEFIQKKKNEGKVRQIGFSYHDNAALLDEIMTAHPEFDFVQLQINYLDWENKSIQSGKCYETARKHKKPIIGMEPVKGGTLAKVPYNAENLFKEHQPEMSVSSWAIRYVASLEGVMMVLSGMSDIEQLLDNTKYMQTFKPFTEKEYTIIKNVVGMINESISIPCTSCRYCVESCPKDIAIPEYFALYNNEKQSLKSEYSLQKLYYTNYAKTHGKASDCIECKNCENNCPQHIDITNWLKKVSEMYEK